MTQTAKQNLQQLKDLLSKIDAQAYTQQHEILSGASIGQHVRHLLEFYQQLLSGANSGTICYDTRERNPQLQNNTSQALAVINTLVRQLAELDLQAALHLQADHGPTDSRAILLPTTVQRELLYCIEHSIHHQALIKVGLIAQDLLHLADDQFGVAYSTIRYRKPKCAQ